MVDFVNLVIGLYSVGFFKVFDWLGIIKMWEEVFWEVVLLGNVELELIDWEFRWEVFKVYYQLVFIKNFQQYYWEKQELMSWFVDFV